MSAEGAEMDLAVVLDPDAPLKLSPSSHSISVPVPPSTIEPLPMPPTVSSPPPPDNVLFQFASGSKKLRETAGDRIVAAPAVDGVRRRRSH